jgi:TM2 domain-containing membrane protein YozV
MGLSAKQVDLLREEHHVYIQETGRASIGYVNFGKVFSMIFLFFILFLVVLLNDQTYSGMNSSNLEYVARSINAVIRKTAD